MKGDTMTRKPKSERPAKKYFRILYDATDAGGNAFRPNAEIVLEEISLEHAIRRLIRHTRLECKARRGLDASVEIRLVERVTEAEQQNHDVTVLVAAQCHLPREATGPSSTVDFE